MNSNMKKCFTAIVCFVFLISTASASGLFPGMNDLFGIAMPAIKFAIQREPEKATESEDTFKETYSNFSYSDYQSFGKYLGACEAEVLDYSVDENSFSATISVNDATMQFSYNWITQTGEACYPSETRVENESTIKANGKSIFPPVGGVMPSIQFAINRKPSTEDTVDNNIVQVYKKIDDNCYLQFSEYLGQCGASVSEYTSNNGIMQATIIQDTFSFTFKYDWNNKEAYVYYPEGTRPEKEKRDVFVGEAIAILPELSKARKELPRLSQAILREPTSSKTNNAGDFYEYYSDFSEDDYNSFSKYLLSANCNVDDYWSKDGAIVIELSNMAGSFSFTYDTLKHEATVKYPPNAQIEKAWAPTPTPRPTSTPAPTPVKAKYSEEYCWESAKSYFMNLRWNDPSSVTIFGHTSIYLEEGELAGTYSFNIDYSAANIYGGKTRDTYTVLVSAIYGMTIMGFGNVEELLR